MQARQRSWFFLNLFCSMRGSAAPCESRNSVGIVHLANDLPLYCSGSNKDDGAQTAARAAPPSAHKITTSHGGTCHMNSRRNAAQASPKSPALSMAEVQTG